MLSRPETTMFNLVSADFKICTGPSYIFDFDEDLPRIPEISEGLHQYYDLEKETDLWSFSSGVTMMKMASLKELATEQLPVTMVVVDREHMAQKGVRWLSKKYSRVIIATAAKQYQLDVSKYSNVELLHYDELSLRGLFNVLKEDYGCERLTLQVGGTLADALFKAKVVDHISLVVAPIIVGGKNTPTLVDGRGVESFTNMRLIPTLHLVKAEVLKENYLHLLYDVNKSIY